MKHFFKLIWLCVYVTACKCPQLATPTIVVNEKEPNQGSTLILTIPEQKNAVGYWSGPTGTKTGNNWIIDNVSPEMSGRYSVQYISRRKKCTSDAVSQQIFVKTCPNLPKPTIQPNSEVIDINSKMVLSVPFIEGVKVSWSGPGGTFLGNPWIRDSLQLSMTGEYSAKYVYTEITGCQSQTTAKKIIISNRTVQTKYKDVEYCLVLK